VGRVRRAPEGGDLLDSKSRQSENKPGVAIRRFGVKKTPPGRDLVGIGFYTPRLAGGRAGSSRKSGGPRGFGASFLSDLLPGSVRRGPDGHNYRGGLSRSPANLQRKGTGACESLAAKLFDR